MPASNIFQQFGLGQQQAQQEQRAQEQQGFLRDDRDRLSQVRDLTQQAASGGVGSEAFKSLVGVSPSDAGKLRELLQTDDQGLDAAFQDASVFKNLLQNDPSGQSALQFGAQRLQAGQSVGRNMIHTQRFMEEIQQDPASALGSISSFVDIPAQLKKAGSPKATETATQKDFSTFQGLLAKAKESGNEKDMKKAERFGRAARFIRETEQEKADIKVSQKEREAVAKANVARKQGFIDSGIEAANGAANVGRALNLLDEVATGGFDNLALKAKRIFGVEGANEGELSNLMGKAVLAQLKPIFGAAFTAREGDALAELEAKFSNSAANNKRLLENALKLINRAARRGIAAAENQGDEFTANEIREALSFNLADKSTVEQPETQQPSTIGRFTIEVQ